MNRTTTRRSIQPSRSSTNATPLKLLRDGGSARSLRAEAAAYTVWAEPGDDALQLRRARRPIAGYADWFDRIVLLRPVATGWNDPARFTADAGAFPLGDALGSISYTLLGLFVLAVFGGVVGWRRGRRGDRVLRCVCVVGLVLIGYSLLIGNALDYRENNRFRVETAPVVLVLATVGAELLLATDAPPGEGTRRSSTVTTEADASVASGPSRLRGEPSATSTAAEPDESQVPPRRDVVEAELHVDELDQRDGRRRPARTRAAPRAPPTESSRVRDRWARIASRAQSCRSARARSRSSRDCHAWPRRAPATPARGDGPAPRPAGYARRVGAAS